MTEKSTNDDPRANSEKTKPRNDDNTFNYNPQVDTADALLGGTSSPKDLKASLTYAVGDGKNRPWTYRRPRTKHDVHDADEGGTKIDVEVVVSDGRHANAIAKASGDPNHPNRLSLETSGFELCPFPADELGMTKEDYYDPTGRKLRNVYYPFVVEYLKQKTGAAHVRVIHHSVRNGSLVNERNRAIGRAKRFHGLNGYSPIVHSDILHDTSVNLFERFSQFPDSCKYRTGRYVILNVWRNIGEEPVRNNHLALADERSLSKPNDLIVGDLFLPGGVHNSRYLLDSRNARRHKWYYFPEMTKREAVVLKLADSDRDRVAQHNFHTGFVDPTAPPGTLGARESVDVRCICYFPQHMPNTVPPVGPIPTQEECIRTMVREVMPKIARNIHRSTFYWPGADDLPWVVDRVRNGGKKGIREVIEHIMQDRINLLELKDKSPQLKAMYTKALEDDGTFEEALKEGVAKIEGPEVCVTKKRVFEIAMSANSPH